MARRQGRGRRRAAPRGFTLIELMIALVVSSLLVGMILAIFMRISIAYRGQQQVAEVQGKLAAARAKLELEAKLAGHGMPNGFRMADGALHPALRVINNADAPDEIAFYYADPSVQAATRTDVGSVCDNLQCDRLDSTEGFAEGDVVVRSTVRDYQVNSNYPAHAPLVRFDACVLQISSRGPTYFVFSTAPPWGTPDNGFCQSGAAAGKTVFHKLGARHWRIDPARPADGVLQLSQLGSLIGVADWQDQAYGFTDLQIATRFYDPNGTIDTPDPDPDPKRNWYSGEGQESLAAMPDLIFPIQVTISLVARTERDVEGIATASTPDLTVAGNADHNRIGDRAAIPLPSVLPELAGHRIYRHTTFQIDLRNLGVGL